MNIFQLRGNGLRVSFLIISATFKEVVVDVFLLIVFALEADLGVALLEVMEVLVQWNVA